MKILMILPMVFLISLKISIGQPVLKFEENKTLTWQETIEFYEYLQEQYTDCKLEIAGETDSGKPLHLFIISKDRLFNPDEVKKKGKAILLINNGIHPGEPCGVDASAAFALDLLSDAEKYGELLENTTIIIIPLMNVGGALNRGSFHRANQNGPEEHGFRANASYNDLNRDFIKLDTRNAVSFVEIMRKWDPDLLVDTHTSNGADYQYVLTLIASQTDKLNPPLGEMLENKMLPQLYEGMKSGPYEMCPYVMSVDHRDPKSGLQGFMDYPRYTTGYASLFNCPGFTIETHMFKPYRDRVLSTYHFLHLISRYVSENKEEITGARALANESLRQKKIYTLDWKPDTVNFDEFLFKGYEIKEKISPVTGLETYYFDRESPWEMPVRNFCHYLPEKVIHCPEFYIVPQAWQRVLDRLRLNGVEMYPLERDTQLMVDYYYIESFETASNPYNGHYSHSNTRVRTETGILEFFGGDMLIPMNQTANEFIVQVLEPEAPDSYFNWNFFDSVLSRKEYFSPYVFDEIAWKLLDEDPILKAEFGMKRNEDASFRENHYAQLRFIYEHSPYAEKGYMRYPIAAYNPSEF